MSLTFQLEISAANEKKNDTSTNQFINTSRSISSDERDNVSNADDSVLSICPQCPFSTVSMQSLDSHMASQHGDDACMSKENKKFEYNREDKIKEENIFGENFEEMGEFFGTAILDSQSKSESSSVNGKLFSDSRRRYRCNICPVTFPWHGDLAAHLSDVHGFQKPSRDGGKTRAGSYKCSFCMYVAKYQSELKRHRRLHMGVKPFGCVFCKYRSAWKGDLKRHIESHHRGHFNSEEELASIMAQYKNNAGTDIKGAVENDSLDNMLLSEDLTKDEVTKTMENSKDLSKNFHQSETFLCSQSSFETRIKEEDGQKHSENTSVTENQSSSPQLEEGLNLSVTNQNPFDFSANFISDQSSSPKNLPSTAVINLLSNSEPLSLSMQGMNSDLLSTMVSQSNLSFNDIVRRMFTCMNGIIPQSNTEIDLLNIHLQDSSHKLKETLTNEINHVFFKNERKDVLSFPSDCINLTTPNGTERKVNSNVVESGLNSTTNDGKLKYNSPISQQEHWKRFKCSACGHRSNWKWDINKHIKVAHPEREGIATIELSYEEAKNTLQSYLNSTKANKGRSHNSFESDEGYYRPYKCSACGHRSNWKWDVNKHIKQIHQRQAEVITLSMEEAKNTISQYKRRRRAPGVCQLNEHLSNQVGSTTTNSVIADKSNISSPLDNNSSIDNESEKEKGGLIWKELSNTSINSTSQNPRIDSLRLKRLKCDCCGYRSNYRSDISRHIRRKHNNNASIVFLADLVYDGMVEDSKEVNDFNGNLTQPMMTESFYSSVNQQRKQWQCNLCPFSHREKIQVSLHITRSHDPQRPFNCKLCQYGTDYRNSLLRHVKAKHKISSIHEVMSQNLTKVKFFSNSESSVSNNLEEINNMEKCDSNVCPICLKVFSSYPDLFQHTVSIHSTSDEDMYLIFRPGPKEKIDMVPKTFRCSQCPFYSSDTDAVQIHEFQHSKTCHYPFQCPHCSYKASHNKFLNNHISLHSYDDVFYSNNQPEDLSFSKKEKLVKGKSVERKRDRKINSRFFCKKCQYKSSNIYHLRVHVKRYHNVKCHRSQKKEKDDQQSCINPMEELILSYKYTSDPHNQLWCDECGFLTDQNDEFKKHLQKHLNHNDCRHQCSLCTYRPDSDLDLKNHEMLHIIYEVNNFKEHFYKGSGQLKCDYCNFVTNVTEKLEFHNSFHFISTCYQGFNCPKCSFKHSQLYGLIKHLTNHH